MHPTSFHLTDQIVARWRKTAFHRLTMVLHLIHPGLRMLHPNSHGERFRLNEHVFGMKQFEHVSRTVARGKDDRFTSELVLSSLFEILDNHSVASTALDNQIDNFRIKSHLPPSLFYGFAHRRHHRWQSIGANVRMCFHKDGGVRTVQNKPLQRLSNVSSLLAPGVNFPSEYVPAPPSPKQ